MNGTQSPLTTAWQAQSEWSDAAGALKSRVEIYRIVILLCIFLGAALGTLTLQLEESLTAKICGYVGAIALALVPVLRFYGANPQTVAAWTRARSASESIKSEVYTLLVGTGAYRLERPNAELRLQNALNEIQDSVSDLEIHAARSSATSGALPDVKDIDSYIENRIDDQTERFYRPKAATYARRLNYLRIAEVALSLLAAALAAVATTENSEGWHAWVAVVTTVIAALASHVEASRYEHLVLSYRRTDRRLKTLRDKWRASRAIGPATAEEEDFFVQNCEEAISVENQGWMTALTNER